VIYYDIPQKMVERGSEGGGVGGGRGSHKKEKE
jgi:hypothetical protein